MKRSALRSLTIVAVAVTLGSSLAVAQSSPTKADVPFDFWVNGHHLQAGHYEISNLSSQATLISSMSNQSEVFGLFNRCESREMQRPKLVFQRVDDHYFLSQVWMHQGKDGLEVPPSRIEKELRIAYEQVPAGAETVVIALR